MEKTNSNFMKTQNSFKASSRLTVNEYKDKLDKFQYPLIHSVSSLNSKNNSSQIIKGINRKKIKNAILNENFDELHTEISLTCNTSSNIPDNHHNYLKTALNLNDFNKSVSPNFEHTQESFNNNYTTNREEDVEKLVSLYMISGDGKSKRYDKSTKEEIIKRYHLSNKVSEKDIQLSNTIFKKTEENERNKDSPVKKNLKPTMRVIKDYFKNHLNATKKIKFNKQIFENVNSLLIEKQYHKYMDDYSKFSFLHSKIKSMPKIKVVTLTKKDIDIDDQKGLENISRPRDFNPFSKESLFINGIELRGTVISSMNNKPKSRSLSPIILIENKIYLFGGHASSLMNDLWECEIKDFKFIWKLLNPLNNTVNPRFGHTMNVYKKSLIIYGGSQLIQTQNDCIVIYDIFSNKYFIQKCSHRSEVKWRKHHVSQIIGSHLFIYGGLSDNDEILNDCFILDLVQFNWITLFVHGEFKNLYKHSSALVVCQDKRDHPNFTIYKYPDLPTGRGITKIKHEGIYIFGGIDKDRNLNGTLYYIKIGRKPLNLIEIDTKGKGPEKRMSASLNFYEKMNLLILFGGKSFSIVFNDLYLLDLESLIWTKVKILETYPIERAEHSSIIYDNKLLIFGGTNNTKIIGSDFFVLNLDIWEKSKKSTLGFKKRAMETKI